jgi:PTS system nitrogen regulatory IIA component
MEIADFTTPRGVIADLHVADKAQALRELARRASTLAGLDVQAVHKALIEREQLGSTGIGRHVALPHARIPGLTKLHGVFVRLDRPIDFESVDQQPVDLVFLLLAPDNAPKDQIAALARISHLFRDATMCEKLRRAADAAAIYELLTGPAR